MSSSEQSEPRTPPQRRLVKTDVPGVYKRGSRYVAVTQFRGKLAGESGTENSCRPT
jgi:hypothetical protein